MSLRQDRHHRVTLAARLGRLSRLAQLTLAAIAVGYAFVQVVEGGYYRQLADSNRLRKLAIESPRGRILDRGGRVLAENVPRYDLRLDRSLTGRVERSLAFAARILGQTPAALAERLAAQRGVPAYKPITVAEALSLEAVARFGVAQLEHPELEIAVEHRRLYRHAHQTAHLLGYLGEVTADHLAREPGRYAPGDLIGKRGIEQAYDDHLRGERGEQVVVVDSHGRLIEEYERVPARAGNDLVLTLDLDLQQEAMELLADKVGAIVALDPRQGDVLALASSPSFDPNLFSRRIALGQWQALLDHPHDPLQNRPVQNRYPPGSVFKIVMAFAALQETPLDPAERVYCRGSSTIYNHRYRCWKAGGHGWMNLGDAIKHSCNVYFHQLGQRLDVDTIALWARRFGLGRRTDIDLAGETAGKVPSKAWSLRERGTPWYAGETISVATGQGPIAVSPLQVAVMMAAVANGGALVRPRLVRDRQPLRTNPQPALAPRALELVRRALWRVVNEEHGTGAAARLDGLAIAGKTGTAQVVRQTTWTANEALAPEQRDHAWFASYAPFDDPRLVVVVFVEHGGAGSATAAPLAKAMYERFLDTDLAHRPAP